MRSTSGGEWTRRIGLADDHEEANGDSVLTYWAAIDKARALVRGDEGTGDRPPTVGEAIDAYETHLRAHGGDPKNASRVRGHLTPALASKTVSLLAAKELTAWRSGLIAKGLSPAAADRVARAFKASLALAARHDARVANSHARREGLRRLPSHETHNPRNIILPDATVRAIVAAAYAHDPNFGLLIEVAAVTGGRFSQIARLDVIDLIGGDRARLMMPSSRKGKKKPRREPLPIPATLATALKQAARGRPDNAPLLIDGNGERWTEISVETFREITKGLDLPQDATPYALRHSSIVRMLKANIPIRIVAAHHDTSVVEIERTYSKYILADADALTRAALLDVSSPPAAANVVPITGRAS